MNKALVQAPLLGRLIDSIKEDQRLVVIDFGQVSSSLLRALQPFRSRLDGLALVEHRQRWATAETRQECAALVDQSLQRNLLEPSDLVLCWGFLNYLDAQTLGVLFEKLQPYLKPSARVHALIEYSSPTMPKDFPHNELFIEDNKIFLDIQGSSETAPSPRYTPKRLEAMLNGLQTTNTVLLSNGMQEFVFSKVAG